MPKQWRPWAARNSNDPMIEQAMEKSEVLNQHLSDSIRELRADKIAPSPFAETSPASGAPSVPAASEKKNGMTIAPGSFAASLKAMMDEAKAGLAQARSDGLAKVGEAVGKLNEAKTAVATVSGTLAKTIEAEAASVMSELGQISNDLTGEAQ